MSAFLRTAPRVVARPTAARTFSSTATRPVARISIIGHLAASPELTATSTGHEILRYGVASNTGPRDNRNTSWFNVTSFEGEGRRRDFLQSLPKGTMVYVEGDASIRPYVDSEGKNRTSLNIVQTKIEVLKKPATEGSEEHE
ncbi:hypothetical protein B0H63DRAFT_279396 [Podospora didyma]|uniref:SsDNA binding protein n=1 Tax=Podospora didyma TaxID=330526 RepID=A0AAE0N9W6_9PEZI|nr:hypothetical protein B0H63DRAFT_279396 [Podospora didyma]